MTDQQRIAEITAHADNFIGGGMSAEILPECGIFCELATQSDVGQDARKGDSDER